MIRAVDEIGQAFMRVRASAEKAAQGDDAARDRAFEEIFALNNLIGRLGREDKQAMPKMRELQGYVNVVTAGLKRASASEVQQGLRVVDKSIKALRKELASP